MVIRTFAEMVRDLRLRRTVGDKPAVLLLGAGASVDAGIGAMNDLFAFFGCADFDAFSKYIAQTSAAERYRYLSDFLQTRKPAEVTPGYRALAALCAQNYFDLVLTTNMDPLLDDALAAAQLWRRDYLLIVNGVIRPDRLDLLLGGHSPRVKIVKLHGDLFQRFMAWTEEEMDTFLTHVAAPLKQAVAGRDVLVVGHSLRDARIRELAASTGGSLWFTHPQRVPDHLAGLATMRAVLAPEVAFERFFPSLADALQVETPRVPLPERIRRLAPAAEVESGQTLDDLLASVLAIAGPDGAPSSTAFMLASPRVIVCDAYAVNPYLGPARELEPIASDGRRFKARILRTNRSHAFGPTVLKVPDTLRMPGLRLDSAPVQPGEVVQIAVAAGEKTGISRGAVTETVDASTTIEPVGQVADLRSLKAVVRPGASGAPVVDGNMSVRGFIVAGSSDEGNPISFMYPASHWAKVLAGREAGKAVRRRRR